MKTKGLLCTLVIALFTFSTTIAQNLILEKFFTHEAFDFTYSDMRDIKETEDGHFLVVGTQTYPNALGNHFIRLMKLGFDGAVVFDTLLNKLPNQLMYWHEARAVEETDHGSIVIAGSDNHYFSERHMFLLGLDADLDTIWNRIYDHGHMARCTDMLATPDGFLLIGEHQEPGASGIRLIKTGLEGELQWDTVYFRSTAQTFTNTALHIAANDTGFVLTGHVDSSLIIMHITSTGDSVTAWKYHFNDDSWGVSLHGLDDGYLVGGMTRDTDHVTTPFIMRLDTDGKIVWQTDFPDEEGHVNAIERMGNGHVIVTGSENFEFYGIAQHGGFLTALDGDGGQIWSYDFADSNSVQGADLHINPESYITVIGSSTHQPWFAAFDPVVTRVSEPKQTLHFNVYPNPANDHMTVVTHGDMQSGYVELLSSVGTVIRTREINHGQAQLDLRELPASVYLVRVSSDQGASGVRKIVLQ